MKNLFPVFLVFLILSAGCGGMYVVYEPEDDPKPKYFNQEYLSEDLSFSDFEEGTVALGGVVVRDSVSIHRKPDLPPWGPSLTIQPKPNYWPRPSSGSSLIGIPTIL